jgi:hypothetical protein
MNSRVQEGVRPERSPVLSLASGLTETNVARVQRVERKEERRDGDGEVEVGLLEEEGGSRGGVRGGKSVEGVELAGVAEP